MEEVPLDKIAQEGFSELTPESGARGSQQPEKGAPSDGTPKCLRPAAGKALRGSGGGQPRREGSGQVRVTMMRLERQARARPHKAQPAMGKMTESSEEQERASY